MRMQIDVTIEYGLQSPGPAILLIEAAGVQGQELLSTFIDFGPLDHFARLAAEEGIGERIIIRTAEQINCRYQAQVRVTRPRPDFARLVANEVDEMPGDALRYLLPSRYCPAEKFGPFVNQRFADLEGGPKVAAIRDWIEQRLDYVSGVSTPDTTAADTFLERRGVCRDYAHLMIALCRAAGIPARIASVFSPKVEPSDFHAVAEVFLSNGWHLIDPTGMANADQMAVIAVGRDAIDVAFLTTNTPATLQTQQVNVIGLDAEQ